MLLCTPWICDLIHVICQGFLIPLIDAFCNSHHLLLLATSYHQLQDDLEFVSYQGDGPAGPQYSINMLAFLNYMCLKHLESAARNK
jgi:hypothetical protein